MAAAAPDGSFARDIPLWVNTFENLSTQCGEVSDLCDGVLLSEVMKAIAPGFFEYEVTHGSSWSIHKVNLAHLVSGLDEYFRVEHKKGFNLQDVVDVDSIARDKDEAQLKELLQFIVGAAMVCENKQYYISAILDMVDESQATLMTLAKAHMQREAPFSPEAGGGSSSSGDGSGGGGGGGDDWRRVRELEDEVERLEREKKDAEREKEREKEQAEEERAALQKSFDEELAKEARKASELRLELDLAQQREGDYEQRSGREMREAAEKWERQVRALEEEKDILSGKLEDYNKLKSQGEKMRAKIEDMDGEKRVLRDRLSVVEDSNAKRLDRILELESESKDRDFMKKKMEQHKNSSADLDLKVIKLTAELGAKDGQHRAEVAGLQEKLKNAEEQAAYFEGELEDAKRELREKIDEAAEAAAALGPGGLGSSDVFVPPEVSERLTRLERENEALKASAASAAASAAESDQSEAHSSGAEERERRCAELEAENARLKREAERAAGEASATAERLAQAAVRAKDAEAAASARGEASAARQVASALASAEAKAAIAEAKTAAKLKELERALELAQSKVASHQALTLTVNKLNEKLKAKETEAVKLTSDKAKLEEYTKTALHNVQDKYMLAIKTLKEQVAEKDDKVARLTEQYKQYRSQSQREATLLSSAIYELGMNITEQRLVRNLDRSAGASSSSSSSAASAAAAAASTAGKGAAGGGAGGDKPSGGLRESSRKGNLEGGGI